MEERQSRSASPEKYIMGRTQNSYTSGERRIILHVYGVLRKENPEMSKKKVAERVHILTGACRATLEQLKKEFNNGPLVTPGLTRPNRKGQYTRMTTYSESQKTAIRRKVHELFRQNIPFTSEKVTNMINEDPDLPNVTDRTTRRLLNDLGFKFERQQKRFVSLNSLETTNERQHTKENGLPFEVEVEIHEDNGPMNFKNELNVEDNQQMHANKQQNGYQEAVLDYRTWSDCEDLQDESGRDSAGSKNKDNSMANEESPDLLREHIKVDESSTKLHDSQSLKTNETFESEDIYCSKVWIKKQSTFNTS